MRNFNSFILRIAALWCVALLTFPAPAFATTPDAIAGKWLGTLDAAHGRSEFGLEIKTNSTGQISASLYLEQMHYFADRAALGPVTLENGTYHERQFGLEMTVAGDELRGFLGASRRPFALRRVEALPVEAPIPELPRGPGPKWALQLGGKIWAHAAVRDGFAYLGDDAGVFSAVRLSDGTFAWNFPAGRPIFGEALVTADAVYFGCDNGFLFKLNREDGKEIWRYDLGDSRISRVLGHPAVFDYDHHAAKPVMVDDTVYLGASDGGFHAVNSATGERVWRHQAKGKIRTAAVAHGAQIIFGTLDGELTALERSTGSELWKLETRGAFTTTPTIHGETVITGSRGSVLRALRLENRQEVWRHSYWGSWVEATPVYGEDGLAYLGTSDFRRITCFDPIDGRVVWRTDVFGTSWGRPALTPNLVYVANGSLAPYFIRHEGGVTALDRKTGAIRWRWPLPNPPGVRLWGFAAGPVLAGDLIVAGSLNGTLYAFPAE